MEDSPRKLADAPTAYVCLRARAKQVRGQEAAGSPLLLEHSVETERDSDGEGRVRYVRSSGSVDASTRPAAVPVRREAVPVQLYSHVESVGSAANVCGIYKIVRPILALLAGAIVLPKKWREAIQTLMSVLDTLCP